MQTIIMKAELEGQCFWHSENDYSAEWKLWLFNRRLCIEELPLSWELNNQLTEWIEFYEDNSFTYKFDELVINNFDIVGRQLWQLVQEELAGKYKVVYFSELERKVLDE